MKRVLPLLAIAVLSGGCSVDSLESQGIDSPQNECTADSDCGDGKCDASLNVCIAPTGQFGKVLFEVTPPSNAGEFAGVGFLLTEDVSLEGGELPLALGVVSRVKGSVSPTKGGYGSGCALAYGDFASATAPVKLTFTPSARLLGLPAEKYTVKTTKNDSKGVYEFKAFMPPDEYDVYIEPDLDSDGFLSSSCPVVPQLRRVPIASGEVIMAFELTPPNQLELDVVWPKSPQNAGKQMALDGWTVDVIDPVSGHVLSAPASLSLVDTGDPDNQHFVADVVYTPLPEGNGSGQELVRIKPKAGVTAPTLAIERGALDAFTPGKATINQLKELPTPVTLDILQLVDADGAPQSSIPTATVRFVSTKLDGVAQPAFFERTVEAVDGKASNVELLPGAYEIYVAPAAGSGFSTTVATLSIGASTTGAQGGKTVTLEPVSDVGGSVSIPSGADPAAGAIVVPTASPRAPTALQLASGTKPFEPLSSTGIVGEDGQFSLQADPGTFDFAIRPPDGTGYSWLVRPNVEVQSGIHDLGAMTLPLPVVYQGAVTVPGGEAPVVVPGAQIRAYLFLNSGGYTADRSGATAVVQIAETRAGDDGSFRLFLPSHLN